MLLSQWVSLQSHERTRNPTERHWNPTLERSDPTEAWCHPIGEAKFPANRFESRTNASKRSFRLAASLLMRLICACYLDRREARQPSEIARESWSGRPESLAACQLFLEEQVKQGGDRFDTDCVRHHALFRLPRSSKMRPTSNASGFVLVACGCCSAVQVWPGRRQTAHDRQRAPFRCRAHNGVSIYVIGRPSLQLSTSAIVPSSVHCTIGHGFKEGRGRGCSLRDFLVAPDNSMHQSHSE